jgi:hypothetical protein
MKYLAILGCFALGGCGLASYQGARTEYQASAAEYKACLGANPSTPQRCEGLRLAMEADERKYTNIGAGTFGQQDAGQLTILNR